MRPPRRAAPTSYEHLHGVVLAALVDEDPMGLSDPAIDLADEYDSETREIARRLVHAGRTDDPQAVAETVADVFSVSFDHQLSSDRAARVAASITGRAIP